MCVCVNVEDVNKKVLFTLINNVNICYTTMLTLSSSR